MNDAEQQILSHRINPRPAEFTATGDEIYKIDSNAVFTIRTKEEVSCLKNIFHMFWNCDPVVRYENADTGKSGEAYAVTVSENGITISAENRTGVLHALKTLRQLAEQERGVLEFSCYELPYCEIADAPRIGFRALHICWFPENKQYQIERAIRLAAYYKFNYVILETWGVFPFKTAPFLCWQEYAVNRKELARIIAEAKELGLTIIPQFNILGHASGSRENGGKHVTINRFPQYASLFEPDGWSFCLSNPETKRILSECVLDMWETFGRQPFFHIGSDEARLLATCRTCRRQNKKELVKSHLLYFYDLLKEHGTRAMMWHDMLIDYEDPRWAGYTACASQTEGLTNLYQELPKDIVICDWNYGYPEKEDGTPPEWPTSRFFNDNGFDVTVSPWYNQRGIQNQAELVEKESMFGYIGTTWAELDLKMFYTIAQGAAAAWHAGDTAKSGPYGWYMNLGDYQCQMHHHLRQMENDMDLRDYESLGNIALQMPEKVHF